MSLQDPTWNIDTCVTSHLNSNARNLSTLFNKRLFSSIHVVMFTRDNNCTIEFDSFGFSVKDFLTRHILLRCDSSGNLYLVTKPSTLPAAFVSTSSTTWHQRLGHPEDEVLRYLSSRQFISCNKAKSTHVCHACQHGKHVKLPFHSLNSTVKRCFDIIHSDLWTSPIVSSSGFKYYVLFLDHFSHYVWIYPLKHKSNMFDKFVHFRNYVKKQFQCEIKSFQCDHGGEFDNEKLHTLFNNNGIQLRFSCPKTSQQNDKAERMIRIINNVIHTFLFQAHLPSSFWVEALYMTTYLLNLFPSTAINNEIPFTKLFNKAPNSSRLRIFGCLCYPHLHSPHKLAPRVTPCIFLGFPAYHRSYRCLDLETNKTILSRHVTFDETQFPYKSMTPSSPPSYTFLEPSTPSSILHHIHNTTPVGHNLPTPPVIHSGPNSPPTSPIGPTHNHNQPTPPTGHAHHPTHDTTSIQSHQSLIPYHTTQLQSTSSIPNIDPAPARTHTMVTRSQRHKFHDDGTLSRYKARLVANGSSEQLGVDFDETFNPVVKPGTIRMVLSFVVSQQWPIHQLDVMPLGLVFLLVSVILYCLYIHRVLRSLYGLKQEPYFAALKRILRYVQGTLELGLHLYASATTSLVGYTDADWAGYPSTCRSTSGYCVFLGDNLLSWSAKQQHTISCSSAEAEYRETAWIRNLFRELHYPLLTATLVYCDNVSAVYISANPVQHQRTKHIEIDIHFVRDMVKAGHVRVLHVPSCYQYADIFTKGLPSALFKDFRSSLSVRPPPAQTAEAY
nr:ribonuclease H-like domain-containing protein [Tanacetum cinerariifolium]